MLIAVAMGSVDGSAAVLPTTRRSSERFGRNSHRMKTRCEACGQATVRAWTLIAHGFVGVYRQSIRLASVVLTDGMSASHRPTMGSRLPSLAPLRCAGESHNAHPCEDWEGPWHNPIRGSHSWLSALRSGNATRWAADVADMRLSGR